MTKEVNFSLSFDGPFTGRMRLEDEAPAPVPDPIPPPPGPSPIPPTDEPVTMFAAGEIKLFVKDLDASPQCRALGGYLRGGVLTAWFEAGNLTGADGVVAIQPNKILDRIKFGGVGPKMVGPVVFHNDEGADWILGAAEWLEADTRKIGFRFRGADEKGHLMEARTTGTDYPFQFAYGVVVRFSIPLP
jgi:hypothetical protein